jgi:DNA polymerase-3 subunit epsilon/ATP-dependent DNA helicase DinG
MPTIVALDIETTGLDPQRDAIIESAVRFQQQAHRRQVGDLINLDGQSPFHHPVTGITNNMVASADDSGGSRRPGRVRSDDPVISHQVSSICPSSAVKTHC